MAPERPTFSSDDRPLGGSLGGGGLGGGGLRGWWKWLVALASFALFLAVLWYAYRSGTGADGGPIRTVTADPEPYKVKPEDPGGEKIPNQDKLVYGEAVGRPEQPPETLARPSEAPVDRPRPVKAPEPKPEPKPEPEAAKAEEPAPVPEPVEAKAEPPAAAPATLQAPQPAPQPAPKQVASTGGYRVQIGSFKDQAAADEAWARIAPKHPAVIGGTDKIIKQADLGAKGVWYRLQFGPYDSREAADKACAQLKAAGQDCLVDAP